MVGHRLHPYLQTISLAIDLSISLKYDDEAKLIVFSSFRQYWLILDRTESQFSY